MSYDVTQIANELLLYSADNQEELMTNMKLQKNAILPTGFSFGIFWDTPF